MKPPRNGRPPDPSKGPVIYMGVRIQCERLPDGSFRWFSPGYGTAPTLSEMKQKIRDLRKLVPIKQGLWNEKD